MFVTKEGMKLSLQYYLNGVKMSKFDTVKMITLDIDI